MQLVESAAGVTVETYLHGRLGDRRALRESSTESCRGTIGKYVVPELGTTRLAELSPTDIDAAYCGCLVALASATPLRRETERTQRLVPTSDASVNQPEGPCVMPPVIAPRSGEAWRLLRVRSTWQPRR